MKICLLGDFSQDLDEGYKNISHYLATQLEKRASVLRLNVKQAATPGFWRAALRYRPDILHVLAQPTSASLVLLRALRLARPRAKAVVSALRTDRYFPDGRISATQRLVLALARPDLVIVQNERASELFSRLGCAVSSLPNGVDLERFKPASPAQRRELRLQHGLSPQAPVVFHAGHLMPSRNLLALRPLAEAGIQVAVAGSLYMGTNQDYIQQLEAAGFRLFKGYQPQVEQLYALADCYIFPPGPATSITMPLSVLEAMACNLPVLTTRYSGLAQAFTPNESFRFLDDEGQLLATVQELIAERERSTTREMVRPFSWERIGQQLEAYYKELIDR
jgi:glycosyltransferase involved in cell wall biosynthesis